jgi:hypothetical protein
MTTAEMRRQVFHKKTKALNITALAWFTPQKHSKIRAISGFESTRKDLKESTWIWMGLHERFGRSSYHVRGT